MMESSLLVSTMLALFNVAAGNDWKLSADDLVALVLEFAEIDSELLPEIVLLLQDFSSKNVASVAVTMIEVDGVSSMPLEISPSMCGCSSNTS